MTNRFYLCGEIVARADSRLKSGLTCAIFEKFTYKTATLKIENGEENTLVIGEIEIPALPSECEYSLAVNEKGVAIVGRDYCSFMRGFFSMLLKIEREMGKRELFISSVSENKSYALKNRMVHLCIFPETTLLDIKKYIRLFALLQFTHVVIEPWGMLKYDTLPELAWECAFTKDEMKELTSEARALGIEPIPMLNSLGHASCSRSISGKHTSLDTDISLYHLFTPDGWAWDLENEEVWHILKGIRNELYEVFGNGEYFHLGFDESHMHNKNPELSKKLPYYMSRLTSEVEGEGRRPMVWTDMLLPPDAFVNMCGNEHSQKSREECLKIISGLAKNTVFIDWEYFVKHAPISSVLYFKDLGIDIMGASWLDVENAHAHIDTVRDNDLFGYMLTTWHTLTNDFGNVIPIAKKLGAALPVWENESTAQMISAALLRMVTVEKTDYSACGWVKKQI